MEKTEVNVQENAIKDLIQRRLPDLVDVCKSDVKTVVLHQDAFAADYQVDELFLFGAAMKYAGMYNKVIHVHGTNRETLS